VHAVLVRGGEIVEAAGDPGLVTFMRSAAKPFQALPLVRAHVRELAQDEVAIACASHEALPAHVAAVRKLLARSGASEDELAISIGHNCSGKHAGMLLLARTRGWPVEGYRLPDHPLQRLLLAEVASAAEFEPEEIGTAVDGCGVVTFALPLRTMAHLFARLMRDELPGSDEVVEAMRALPGLVGGPRAVDTLLMRAREGLVAKRGAEGILCGALADGTGFAIKVEDGASRALGPAAAFLLGVGELAETPLENSRGDVVGRVRVES
jgi:L-asparaginase II